MRGQVTTERLIKILNSIALNIFKRQVVRILTSELDDCVAEGLAPAGRPWPLRLISTWMTPVPGLLVAMTSSRGSAALASASFERTAQRRG